MKKPKYTAFSGDAPEHKTTKEQQAWALSKKAAELIQAAYALGFVVTIETVPRKPLAMGAHDSLAIVRPARVDGKYE